MGSRILIIVLVILTLHTTNPYAAEPLPIGFRDLAWGARPTPDMADVSSYKKCNIMKRKSDSLQIFDTKAESIYYYFCNGKLISVLITFDGNAGKFVDKLKSKYGKPKETKFNKSINARSTWFRDKDTQILVSSVDGVEHYTVYVEDSDLFSYGSCSENCITARSSISFPGQKDKDGF